jgi:hypothetical protein
MRSQLLHYLNYGRDHDRAATTTATAIMTAVITAPAVATAQLRDSPREPSRSRPMLVRSRRSRRRRDDTVTREGVPERPATRGSGGNSGNAARQRQQRRLERQSLSMVAEVTERSLSVTRELEGLSR